MRHETSRWGLIRLIELGATLTREYRGRLHQVDVGDHTFNYQGTTYASLSAIARRITGTRWNGPRFFGLRDAAPTS